MAGLADRGLDLLFASAGSRSALHDTLEDAGHRVVAFGVDRRLASPAIVPGLRRAMRRFGPDIVHSHEVVPALLGGLAARGASEAVRLFHRHHGLTFGRHAIVSRAASRVNHATVAVSASAAGYAKALDRTAATRVLVAHNGVPDLAPVNRDDVLSLRGRFGVPEEGLTVGIIARLRPEKGHRVLFEAAHRLAHRSARPVRVVVVGDGPARDEFRGAARALGVSATFVGHQDELAPWYALSDVVAIPSFADACPRGALEALASGTPVVASDVDGLPELIQHERTGVLVPPGDADALASAIERLGKDPMQRQLLGEAARNDYEGRFTMAAMVDRWITAYDRALRLTRPSVS